MSGKEYDPRPVFELITDSLVVALREKDWAKVEKIYEVLRKLAEKSTVRLNIT